MKRYRQPRPATDSSGFTIVELLVVIIILAILVTISSVVYSGIRERAANAKTQTAVGTLERALRAHKELSGSPLKVNVAWFHVSIMDMTGVCIGGSWPSDSEMQKDLGGSAYTGNVLRSVYCGWYGVTATSSDEVTRLFNEEIAASSMPSSFPKMPSTEPIKIDAIAANSSVGQYTLRGLRYAYNNSSTNPLSYIYYAVYGKTCFPGDATVRFQDTMFVSAGGSEWNGTFTTGGDYTANNTAHCVKTIKY